MNKSYPYTAHRGVVGELIVSLYKKHIMHGHTVRLVFVFLFSFFFLFFLFWSSYPMIRGEILILVYLSPDIPWGYDLNYLYAPLAQSNLFYRANVSFTSSYTEMIHG